MSTNNVLAMPKPKLRAKCSACGMQAGCDCNAPYIPAGEYAKLVVKKNPKKSNRALAEETGISEPTIRRARGASNDARGKRVGKDGKKYSPSQPKKMASEQEYKETIERGLRRIQDANAAGHCVFSEEGKKVALDAEAQRLLAHKTERVMSEYQKRMRALEDGSAHVEHFYRELFPDAREMITDGIAKRLHEVSFFATRNPPALAARSIKADDVSGLITAIGALPPWLSELKEELYKLAEVKA
jgi:hypothetical protein